MSARKETPIRLSPSKETLNRLFAVSGNVCSFPGCDHPVFDEDFELVAQVCHIEAAMPGGERFNTESNNEDRRKQENLMVMCLRHHVKTNNVLVYTTEKLREMKRDHETQFLERDKQVPIPPMAVDKAYDEIKKISEQILTTVLSTDAKVDRLIEQNEQLTALVTAQSAGPADSPFKSEIDRIMSLRDTFNQQSAINLFTKFREDNWDKLTSNEKFRTLANLAICYLEINSDGEAADLFIEALEHEPNLVKALGLAALGYTIKEDSAHAEEMTARALVLDPLDINAYQAVIHTMGLKGETFGTILSAIPEAIRQQHEIAYALAYVARERGLLNDALTWLQIAYDQTEGQKADLTAAIANVLLETINAESFLLNGIVDQDGKNKARLALQYYTEGWAAIAASTLRPSRSWWLVNRAVAKKFLGDKQGAYDDVLAAWELNSDFWTSRHLAVAALDVRDFEQLHKALARMSETATDEDEKTQTTLFIAEVDVLEGRREQGVAVMEGMLKNGLGEKETIYFRNKLVELYSTAGDTATAEKLIAQMVTEHPDAVRTYITQAQFLNLTGRSNEVRASLEKAKALINDDTTARDMHELAELFYLSGERKIVAKLLERIANPGIYSKITRQLLLAYYEAGEHAKLIKTCEGLLAAYGPIDMVTEMLSWAYEGLDDLPAAVEVLTDYLEIYPADQLIQSRLAFVYYRQLGKENLAKLLATIDHIDQTLPMETQFKLARMFEYIGDLKNFKKFSYEVRRNFYEQAQAHDTFVSMFTEFTPNEAPASKPVAAALHTAVTVKLNDAHVTYIIEDRDHYFKTRGEISPQSPMGAALMGKAVGEAFVLE
ncbi:hypothetical protein NAF17_15355 [Mucilaginibacter sp. RB4R14]|uniref:hypothetical protein n=1 Tax=Mucilaginibacter aurantiaciroseus TaxID=2949308 RepID=UPI002090C680|nr:hypothetical protein [Mucilaginibacter aurantiaciroseus]MCO5936919.1 hypothetical protein [Mucilaginibacter aurantiaciroseus]